MLKETFYKVITNSYSDPTCPYVRVRCYDEACRGIMICSKGTESIDCEICQRTLCAKGRGGCGKLYHYGNCDSTEEEQSVQWLLDNCKHCPRCSQSIEKSEGCNHMTCSSCRTEFCNICNQEIPRRNGRYDTALHFASRPGFPGVNPSADNPNPCKQFDT
jgi:hypothetical protein